MENKMRLAKNSITLLITGIFIGAILSQSYNQLIPRFGNKEEVVETATVAPASPIAQPTKATRSVCEYVDTLHEETYVPSAEDDIQNIIGYQNNKFGIYIYAEVDDYVELADELVNSNGGEWGYVLIPYNVKDRNEERWGELFESLSERKLIPIIQLWDLDVDNDDQNEVDEHIENSAEFLNALKWPINKKYISVYNEPNDARFWKGEIDPEGYAHVLEKTIREFKKLDSDFFMMNAAFNTSARTGGEYLDSRVYMIRMNKEIPGIFAQLDGWASHPYPQPNFSGAVNATGRDSIRAYDWELNILKNEFGVDTSKMPVFITETGWAHIESEAEGNPNGYKFNQHQVADNFVKAFNDVWLKDDKVVAVTPFTIRYEPPFDHFSWLTVKGNPYPQFDAIKNIEKVAGRPPSVTYTEGRVLDCKDEPVETN